MTLISTITYLRLFRTKMTCKEAKYDASTINSWEGTLPATNICVPEKGCLGRRSFPFRGKKALFSGAFCLVLGMGKSTQTWYTPWQPERMEILNFSKKKNVFGFDDFPNICQAGGGQPSPFDEVQLHLINLWTKKPAKNLGAMVVILTPIVWMVVGIVGKSPFFFPVNFRRKWSQKWIAKPAIHFSDLWTPFLRKKQPWKNLVAKCLRSNRALDFYIT